MKNKNEEPLTNKRNEGFVSSKNRIKMWFSEMALVRKLRKASKVSLRMMNQSKIILRKARAKTKAKILVH